MTSDAVRWTYALAPDVDVDAGNGGATLRTATSRTWLDAGDDELELLRHLARHGGSEVQLQRHLRPGESGDDAATRCAALLFHLDRLGFLVRSVTSAGRSIVSCIPLHPPTEALPGRPPSGLLRLSARTLMRVDGNALCIEIPGAWAKLRIDDRDLLPLLHDLALGKTAEELAASIGTHSEATTMAALALMSWCGLFDRAPGDEWRLHDLFFHARTRWGYARVSLGKTDLEAEVTDRSPVLDDRPRVSLEPPDLSRLIAEDPSYALVAERRQSVRRHGSTPITSSQLSEFLFRTLHERDGRRPYPSGGSCYPLNAYLVVHACDGIAPGLYAYSPARHDLIVAAPPGAALDDLLADAAAAANVAEPPQILLVLAARYGRTHRMYGDLAYSLILKEVGAVFQTAMMAGAVMGLATCPLGCGNSLRFSDLLGVDALAETSVGEMMLGSLGEIA